MKTNFQMIRELVVENQFRPVERGILSGDEVKAISKTLCLEEMTDKLQLQNLRDTVVLILTRMQDEHENDFKKVVEFQDLCSAITAVIDHRLYGLNQ